MTREDAKAWWMTQGVHCPECGKLVWRNWRGVLMMHFGPVGHCSGGVPAVDPRFAESAPLQLGMFATAEPRRMGWREWTEMAANDPLRWLYGQGEIHA